MLDRVLSEFDDIETDTGDEGGIIGVREVKQGAEKRPNNDNQDEDETEASACAGAAKSSSDGPPPVDRTLKPQSMSPPALPQKSRSRPSRPNSHDSEGSSHNSSDNSHEYQEINSDLLTPTPGDKSVGKKRQTSMERNRRRGEIRNRRNQNRDIQCSSSDITTLEGPSKPRTKDDQRMREQQRIRDDLQNAGRPREMRNLRKSRSDANFERREAEDFSRRSGRGRGPRRSRSSDRFLDSREPILDPPFESPIDPRLMDPRHFDPRLVDPRLIDPQMADPRMFDPHLIEQIYPMEDPVRFPHLLGYPPMPLPTAMSPETTQGLPLPPGPPGMGPMDFPSGYHMFPYDYHPFLQDQLLPGDHVPTVYDPILIGPRGRGIPPDFPPMDVPGDYPVGYPMDFPVPVDYPIDYPVDYRRFPPEMMQWDMPDRDPWASPTPEEAHMLINRAMR